MIKVIDNITGETKKYEDIEDFREAAKRDFHESVHEDIDRMIDAYIKGEPLYAYEALLGIEIW